MGHLMVAFKPPISSAYLNKLSSWLSLTIFVFFEFLRKENKQDLLQAIEAWISLYKQQTTTENGFEEQNRTFFFGFL